MRKIKIAVLVSGKGSNAKNLLRNQSLNKIGVFTVISSKSNEELKIFCINHKANYIEYNNGLIIQKLVDLFKIEKFDLILLAGFLKLIPHEIISNYKNRIINLHPSLLPKFGGKGMYGSKVHEAVFKQNETYSGITIHQVNEEYDKGKIIEQFQIDISNCRNPEEIENKIKELEKNKFPETILRFIQNTL